MQSKYPWNESLPSQVLFETIILANQCEKSIQQEDLLKKYEKATKKKKTIYSSGTQGGPAVSSSKGQLSWIRSSLKGSKIEMWWTIVILLKSVSKSAIVSLLQSVLVCYSQPSKDQVIEWSSDPGIEWLSAWTIKWLNNRIIRWSHGWRSNDRVIQWSNDWMIE